VGSGVLLAVGTAAIAASGFATLLPDGAAQTGVMGLLILGGAVADALALTLDVWVAREERP